MNFEELKEQLIKNIPSQEIKRSIIGLIECYEEEGKTPQETLKYIGDALDDIF